MEIIQNEETCQHSGCNCPTGASSDYCSDYCKDAKDDGTDAICECGHSDCR